jgi:2-keto-3-deoxy-6-phosphogluconate aldolase
MSIEISLWLGIAGALIAIGSTLVELTNTWKSDRTHYESWAAQQQKKAFDDYVKMAAGTAYSIDQLSKLADLKARGVMTDTEFESQKAKLLG